MFRPAVALYMHLYQQLGINTTQAFEKRLNSITNVEVQDVISKLKILELEWDKFLSSVNPEWDVDVMEVITEGATISTSVELVNARTGTKTDLQSLISSCG